MSVLYLYLQVLSLLGFEEVVQMGFSEDEIKPGSLSASIIFLSISTYYDLAYQPIPARR